MRSFVEELLVISFGEELLVRSFNQCDRCWSVSTVHVDPWSGNDLATRESSTYLSSDNFSPNILSSKLNTEVVRIYIFSFIF